MDRIRTGDVVLYLYDTHDRHEQMLGVVLNADVDTPVKHRDGRTYYIHTIRFLWANVKNIEMPFVQHLADNNLTSLGSLDSFGIDVRNLT